MSVILSLYFSSARQEHALLQQSLFLCDVVLLQVTCANHDFSQVLSVLYVKVSRFLSVPSSMLHVCCALLWTIGTNLPLWLQLMDS
jgi:hypothetical protein